MKYLSEPTDQEVREFMEKYYPEYKDNLELGRILLKRRRGNYVASVGYRKVKVGDIPNMKAGDKVELEGVIVQKIKEYTYEGCAVCKKKVCYEHSGKKKYTNYTFIFSDGSGEVSISLLGKEKGFSDFSDGDIVKIRGKIGNGRGYNEVVVDSYDVVRKVKIVDDISTSNSESKGRAEIVMDIVNFVRDTGGVKKDVVVRMFAKKGLEFRDYSDLFKEYVESGVVYLKVK